jgi:hypothetical protein
LNETKHLKFLLDFSSLGENKKSHTPIQRTYLGKKNAPQTSDLKEIFPKKKTLRILTIGSSKWPKIEQDS